MLKIKDQNGDVVGVLKDEDNAPVMDAAKIKVKKEESSEKDKKQEEPKVEKE